MTVSTAFLLLHSLAMAGRPDSSGATEAVDAVLAYVEAGDSRDLRALKSLTHESFRVVARMPGAEEPSVMPRATYLDLLKAGKIGGTPRETQLTAVLHDAVFATVKGTLDSDAAHFDSTWTLVRTEGRWLVVQDTTVFTPTP